MPVYQSSSYWLPGSYRCRVVTSDADARAELEQENRRLERENEALRQHTDALHDQVAVLQQNLAFLSRRRGPHRQPVFCSIEIKQNP